MAGGVSEFELIERLKSRAGTSARLLNGIGDDASVTHGSGLTVTSVDAVVDGIHFRREWSGPGSIGIKAVATALSDLAAMAARPGEVYVALGLPADVEEAYVEELAASVIRTAEGAGAVLAGGDTVTSPVLFLSVTAVGHAGQAEDLVLRSGARPGHAVAVTGHLGGAAAGLRLLENRELAEGLEPDVRKALIGRQLEPKARLVEARLLAAGGAAAMIDVSDGLAADLGHIAEASRVRINLESAYLPVQPGVAEVAAADPAGDMPQGTDFALAGGEDYELALTLDHSTFEAVRTELRAIGCELTKVGSVVEGRGVVVTSGGRPVDAPAGHEHLG